MKGFAVCPCLPYSKSVASMALLIPPECGSENPILILCPVLFSLTGDSPKERSSSPVAREGYFVPLPTTLLRLRCAFCNTISPPAFNAFSTKALLFFCRAESWSDRSSGSLSVILAIAAHHLFGQDLHIHSTTFYILYRGHLEPFAICYDDVIGGDRQSRNATKTE